MAKDFVIPPVLVDLLTKTAHVETELDHGSTPAWIPNDEALPDEPHEAFLYRVTGLSTELADRSSDMRALVTAYAQAVANPRPDLARLARWQRITPSALRHRYDALHVQGVRELLSSNPVLDLVLEPFPTMHESDFAGVGDGLFDDQLAHRRAMRRAATQYLAETIGSTGAAALGLSGDAMDERAARLIAPLGDFMESALKAQPDPTYSGVYLPMFNSWRTAFEARPVKPADIETRTKRVRRPASR